MKSFNSNPNSRRPVVTGPSHAVELIEPLISRDQEELWAMALSPGKHVLGLEMIFRGTVDQCLAHPRDIIRFICRHNASTFLIAHNHPSGEREVSKSDWSLTHRLLEIAGLVQIPMDDHIVIAPPGYVSLRQCEPSLFDIR